MPDTSIVLSLVDKFSNSVRSINDENQKFSKAAEDAKRKCEDYAKALQATKDQQAKLQVKLRAAKNELKDAEKAFDDCADAANTDALEKAHQKYNALKDDLSDLQRSARDTQKAMRDLNDEGNRGNGGGGSGGGSGDSLSARLGQSGLAAAAGDWASNLAGIYVQSAYGDNAANYLGNALSMAGTGAAIGTAIAPGIGTAIGAVLGSVAGLITAAAEEKKAKDEYFKSSAKETYDSIEQSMADSMGKGITVAAQREMDEIAFNTLLGEGAGSAYLQDLRTLAAKTPMEYTDLTNISRQLAIGFGDDPGRMLELMESIGNAGSAVGIDASGMQTIATGLSRMQSSGKASLEYINLIQERGIDAVGMLAEGLGKSKKEIYEMISKGEIHGVQAVEVISAAMDEMYDGAMEKQSQTFSGLSSTVEDIQTERNAAMGAGFTEERSKGLQEEIAWDKNWGADMQVAYRQIGAFHASMENEKDHILRNALSTVLNGDENVTYGYFAPELKNQLNQAAADYAAAVEAGDEVGMGQALAKAEAIAAAQYTRTDGYELMVDAQLESVENVQAAMANSYYKAGWLMAEQWSLGTAGYFNEKYDTETTTARITAKIEANPEPETKEDELTFGPSAPEGVYFGLGFAYGLDRVPYDGYRAVLHEGERVLTASQARQADLGGSGAVSVDIHDCSFAVRDEGDVDLIAAAIVEKIVNAQGIYAG